jgi:hypothetical protein
MRAQVTKRLLFRTLDGRLEAVEDWLILGLGRRTDEELELRAKLKARL